MSVLVVCGAETRHQNPSCVWSNGSRNFTYPIVEPAPRLPVSYLKLRRWQKCSHFILRLKHGNRQGSPGVLLVFEDVKLRNVTVVFSSVRCHFASPRCAPHILHSSASLANLQSYHPVGSRRCQCLLISMEPVELQSVTLLAPKPATAACLLLIYSFILLFILKRRDGCHRHMCSR